MALGVNEDSTEVGGTFLCGHGTLCPSCHPSCTACDGDNNCLQVSCEGGTRTPFPGYAACVCDPASTDFIAGCANPVCHPSCSSCVGINGNACTACTANGASVASSVGACTSCTSGCDWCINVADTYCWDRESLSRFQFALAAKSLDALPYLTQTNSLLCHRMNVVDVNDCTVPTMTAVMGAFGSAGSYAPTASQCYKQLEAEWPFVWYWFENIFPNFTPPTGAFPTDVLKVKTVLQLWILQFGPSEMKTDTDWQALVTVFNSATTPWATMLAWTSAPPQYTVDGTTPVAFPADLSAWLLLNSADTAAFNTFSEVCGTSGCPASAWCFNAQPASLCAT